MTICRSLDFQFQIIIIAAVMLVHILSEENNNWNSNNPQLYMYFKQCLSLSFLFLQGRNQTEVYD